MASIIQVDPIAEQGPVSLTRTIETGRMDNITVLAPYPFHHFILASELDDSVFQRQRAVCANILDVTIGDRLLSEATHRLPAGMTIDPDMLNDLKSDILAGACESLSFPVAARAALRDFGYYEPLSKALYTDGPRTGIQVPYVPLPEELYARLII